MEAVTRRAYALAGLLLAGAAFVHLATPSQASTRSEKWLEQNSLNQVGHFKMIPGNDSDPLVTYKMDPATYSTLTPAGIVCRELTDGKSTFDVVLIASRAKDSFHDPRVCFTAQGWQFDNETTEVVHTSRGDFPLTVAEIRSDTGKRWAAFGYKSPYGFTAGTNQLKMHMFSFSLTHSLSADGVFYRFIGLSPDVDRAKLLRFIGMYMDSSAEFSHGYF